MMLFTHQDVMRFVRQAEQHKAIPLDSKLVLYTLAWCIRQIDQTEEWLLAVAEAYQYGTIAHLKALATKEITHCINGQGPNRHEVPISEGVYARALQVYTFWEDRYGPV